MNPLAAHRWAYARLWQLANDGNHGRYQRYQGKTSRKIAVMVVTPA